MLYTTHHRCQRGSNKIIQLAGWFIPSGGKAGNTFSAEMRALCAYIVIIFIINFCRIFPTHFNTVYNLGLLMKDKSYREICQEFYIALATIIWVMQILQMLIKDFCILRTGTSTNFVKSILNSKKENMKQMLNRDINLVTYEHSTTDIFCQVTE